MPGFQWPVPWLGREFGDALVTWLIAHEDLARGSGIVDSQPWVAALALGGRPVVQIGLAGITGMSEAAPAQRVVASGRAP